MLLHCSSITDEALKYFCQHQPARKICVLITMADMPKDISLFTDKLRSHIKSLILDSGVFSANNNKKGLNVNRLFKRHGNFLKLMQHKFDMAFNYDLDFSGTNEGFDKNMGYQIELEEMGLDIVPVVHNIYNGEIEYFIDQGYKTVALGYCPDGRGFDDVKSAVERLHSNGVLVHLFGKTEFRFLANLPIWSADSVSWAKYVSIGRLLFWNPKKTGLDKTDYLYIPNYQVKPDPKRGIYYAHYEYLDDFEEHIFTKLNIKVDDLLGTKGLFYHGMVNILYYVELEEIITQMHNEKGFVFNEPLK